MPFSLEAQVTVLPGHAAVGCAQATHHYPLNLLSPFPQGEESDGSASLGLDSTLLGKFPLPLILSLLINVYFYLSNARVQSIHA